MNFEMSELIKAFGQHPSALGAIATGHGGSKLGRSRLRQPVVASPAWPRPKLAIAEGVSQTPIVCALKLVK
jgi:hypothetical protein